MEFNPFGRAPDTVLAEHLDVLRTVREGWYVEYKSALPGAKSIAKSVSSFANTYGGWFCVGVAEAVDSGGRRTGFAGSFPGVASDGTSSALQELANAARLISPVPFFEYWIIEGTTTSDANGGLPAGQSVILVYVPEGIDAPYIHIGGRVYRRVADQSDPTEESSRSVFDALHNRSKIARKRLAKLITTAPEFSKGEAETPYLQLFFLADRYADNRVTSHLTFSEFREVAKGSVDRSGVFDIPCDNFFTSAQGYVARQIMGNPVSGGLLTLNHMMNGTTTALIPMRVVTSTRFEHFAFLDQVSAQLESVNAAVDFDRLLDLNHLVAVVMGVLRKHHRWCVRGGILRPVFAKARLYSVWRKTPFLDTAAFAASIEQNGPAIVQTATVTAPAGFSPESLRELGTITESDDATPMALNVAAFPLVIDILRSLGVEPEALWRGISGAFETWTQDDIADVFGAVARATLASSVR